MRKFIPLILLTLTSCFSLIVSRPLTGQKDDFVWVGEWKKREFSLEVTQNKGNRFYGKMIIKNEDTLFLRGMQKGSNHMASYVHIQDSLALLGYDNVNLEYPEDLKIPRTGFVFLWASGLNADSIVTKNYEENDTIIPNGLILRKIKKASR